MSETSRRCNAFLLSFLALCLLHGPVQAKDSYRLERVVVVMRHGIRPPTKAQPVPAEVVAGPWPAWDVGWGELTHHGEQAIAKLAEFDSDSYAVFAGCNARVIADTDQRTLRTAEVYAGTLLKGCPAPIEHVALDQADPRFSPFEGDIAADGDAQLKSAQAALPAGGLAAVDAAQASRLKTLTEIIGCTAAACDLAAQPTKFVVAKGRVKIDGGVDTGSTLAQVLLLQYADGKPMNEVGWGKVDEATIADLSALHAAEFTLVARPKAIAAFAAKPLMAEIKRGMFAPDTAKFTVLVGHDSNLAYLGGVLGVHWKAGDLAEDDPAPGGALIFEKWRNGKGREVVIVRYRAQTLDEMRKLTPLTASATQALSLPFCGGRTACTAGQFLDGIDAN